MNHYEKGEPLDFTIPGDIPGVHRSHRQLFKNGQMRASRDAAQQARDDAAKAAAAAQAKIDQANSTVSGAFDPTFTDDFYNGRQQAYLDYYKPTFDTQQQTAHDQLVSSLASRGLLSSSQGAKEEGDFQKSADDAWQSILKGANDYVTNLKSGVSSSKQQLLSSAGSLTNDVLANQAADAVALRTQAPTFGPVGQLFANLSTPATLAATSGSSLGGTTQTTATATPYSKSAVKTVG